MTSSVSSSSEFQWSGYTAMQSSEIDTCTNAIPSSLDNTQNDQTTEAIYEQDPDNPNLSGQGTC